MTYELAEVVKNIDDTVFKLNQYLSKNPQDTMYARGKIDGLLEAKKWINDFCKITWHERMSYLKMPGQK